MDIDKDPDRRLLTNWLAERHDVSTTLEDVSESAPVRLVIVSPDSVATGRVDRLASPPVGAAPRALRLLVTGQPVSHLDRTTWEAVDDVLETPVRQAELKRRIERLLAHQQTLSTLHERETMVARLHEATREMVGATSPTAVCDRCTDAAIHAIGADWAAIWSAAGHQGRLPLVSARGGEDVARRVPDQVTSSGSHPAWAAVDGGEPVDRRSPPTLSIAERPMRERYIPLGSLGVLGVGWRPAPPVDTDDQELVDLLAANTEAALANRRTAQAVERQASQMEFFNSVLRHDVLNALNVIEGNAEMLVDEVEGPTADRAATVHDWSVRAVDIIKRIERVFEAITGEGPSGHEPVELVGILRNELDTIRETYPAVTVGTELPDELHVRGTDLLGAVFRNLLQNAVVHNDTAGLEITVRAEVCPDRDQVRVTVEDNGRGVPDDRKATVFERNESSATSATGSGFGLFFVETMVTECGGDVRISDTDPTGATVEVFLPLAARDGQGDPH